MFNSRRLRLSWLFTLLCFVHFPTFGMYFVDDSMMTRAYGLDELREEFGTILEMQPKFIQLHSTESQYRTSNGIYKLIPYYAKLSPELTSTDIQSSRFIIHKHIISGQWQLTEFDAYPFSKNIKAFPVTEENENNALLNNCFIQSKNKIQEMKKTIMNMQALVLLKNETIESFKNQNELLTSFVNKIRQEIKKTDVTQNELKLKLIEKENDICEIYKNQNKLELKLIEKNNQIRDCEKLEKEFQHKLLAQKKEIHDFEKKHLETIKQIKEDLTLLEKENRKLSKYQKLNEKLEFENKKLKLSENLLTEVIDDLYVTNHALEKNLKKTKYNLKKYELQQKEEIILENSLQKDIETEKIKLMQETVKLEILNSKIETNILLNLDQNNTASNTKTFDSKIEGEESQTPKMETTFALKQKSKNSLVRTKLNFQPNHEIFKRNEENTQILENGNFSQKENKTKLFEKTSKKQHSTGCLKLIAAPILKEQDKEKENLQQLSELQIIESSILKDDKKKEILDNPSINADTLQKRPTPRFQDGFIKLKQMHKNIQNFYKNESEKQESLISQNLKQKDVLDNVVNHFSELKFLKSEELTKSLTKREDGNKKESTQLLINKIAKILHASRPLNLIFSNIFDEAQKEIHDQTEQHKVLVEDACNRLQDLNDEALTSKILLFLEDDKQNKEEIKTMLDNVKQSNINEEELSTIRLFLEDNHALTTNATYQYELLFMHHGAIMTLIEKLVCFKSQEFFTKFAITYENTLEKVYQKYRKIQFDTLLIIQDKKTKIKIKCFQDNQNLYYAPQYKYEMMFMVIGLIYGAGDILNELLNQIKIL